MSKIVRIKSDAEESETSIIVKECVKTLEIAKNKSTSSEEKKQIVKAIAELSKI